jgi:hypothetical protein
VRGVPGARLDTGETTRLDTGETTLRPNLTDCGSTLHLVDRVASESALADPGKRAWLQPGNGTAEGRAELNHGKVRYHGNKWLLGLPGISVIMKPPAAGYDWLGKGRGVHGRAGHSGVGDGGVGHG